ncbi:pyruvate, phosphate dikinase PpdK [Thermoclostridium stercorarium subsp. stercorarium DSM 8532]|jgi:pyruvate,orthophosphate dikinase|uniref:Pyruvate, phosphate dikinase n=3 Tax=Thermoclostridium stercorarium TaxID=1510 RepID=L7VQP0_THES1|nr:pyruvate, phosphate dikinase [Thermoclostridium stercorarium]AGC68994.1 pyruvate, phosphate dikinase PpdK [Thermoclostridium stercorarium subsp. stercorarium DSM 8532]AGI39972.1 PpdK [Thermoclostridium stercorarium subsp. stercorarium DSM 8532]ANW99292.1 pyruvate, phosphate dikinase [Thermoclostridium stercorarium subsp. thermolacticum DSM 2910]ANX01921.1 pyruvate, phosphate dikinase [Thermoclostridium stercorarium subsp. leptospartum DSM 9219]UZQ84963.1 pyruvate, phosphate dikinase [Thermo
MAKYVYLFSEGNASMRNLLGGKGANLAEMTGLGLPVPRGFTVTTEACTRFYNDGKVIAKEIEDEIFATLSKLEEIVGKKFGDPENPLLVSVRSGARVSMPGMMDTILNLGLNDEVVEGLAKLTQNPRFAYDSYRRFIMMFSDVVMGIDRMKFEKLMDEIKEKKGVSADTELDAGDMKTLSERYKELYLKEMGVPFPQDPKVQLIEAVKAVFRSWENPRAVVYRRLNDIPSDWGTAVNVQEMVFGNMGNDSGTGVAFTRDPSTGEKKLYGEFLMNAQGEDVVAGIRTPQPIDVLKEINPDVYNQFVEIAEKLEKHYRDMQDMEFTIEHGKLFMLQTRNGKRTAQAALKIAVDLVNEGMITKEEALLRVDPKQLDTLLHPQFDPKALKAAKPIAKGLAASPGAATGKIYFSAEEAAQAYNAGEKLIILVRLETSPEDIEGMHVSQGILTGRGGMTSHAAVVARGMGKCCVVGCGEIIINEEEGYFIDKNGRRYNKGDWISLDGSTGNVYGEKLPTVAPEMTGYFGTLMKWADEVRVLKVRTNADTPRDAQQALKFGAEGIGLCRTEHMFFDSDRIGAMREMIVARTEEQRRKALEKLLPMQRSDFEELFRVMKGYPVTIRFLDPPLHEFLPKEEEDIQAIAAEMGITAEELKAIITELHEFNPMLGHRGCRLAVSYPEIAEMQTRAVIEAAINVKKEGLNVVPEIMIPLVGDVKELKYVKDVVVKTAEAIIKETGVELEYRVGTMIEVPRAAITADEIAKEAEFFSFGTNDLTQMTFGFSRDDAGKFLEEYYSKKIYEFDPFAKLDQTGVGELIRIAAEKGRKTRANIKMGICGEHGGDPSSIEFCHNVGLDYVSCSPYRVPIARLAAAQAQVRNPRNKKA